MACSLSEGDPHQTMRVPPAIYSNYSRLQTIYSTRLSSERRHRDYSDCLKSGTMCRHSARRDLFVGSLCCCIYDMLCSNIHRRTLSVVFNEV